jgi:small subunit ribosomal protein S16
MVIIRLARFGRKKGPFYRVVASDNSKRPTGASIEVLGYWNPAKKDFKIEKDKFGAWVKKGAQVSPAVKKLVG